jgi:hypothetical protein
LRAHAVMYHTSTVAYISRLAVGCDRACLYGIYPNAMVPPHKVVFPTLPNR